MSGLLHKPVAEKDGLSLYFIGDVAVIVMDKGENRLNINFINNLNSLLDEVERNESCKGLVTTGKGRFYSNGLDIALMGNLTPEEAQLTLSAMNGLLKRILLFPIPTVAAVNGHAFAGGAFLSLVHDLRVMRNDKGWISINEIFLSMRLYAFLIQIIRSKMGDGRNLTDSAVLGARYTADEALRRGIVHAISSETLLITEAIRLLKSFAGKNGYMRESLSAMKEDVYSDVLEFFDKFQTEFDEREKQKFSKRLSRL